ncbi:serine hydrolase domain-containing protein [Kitasatospora sp. NPDC049285]|uniref:serine hydrolase domain-containing protein n=1 Tax=Kitasatospora sp. NPDC049285 TaxID=3157096 RepID=UPI003444C732
MRRSSALRLAAVLVAAAVLGPVGGVQAQAAPVSVVAPRTVDEDCPLDPALAARLDEAIARVQAETGTPGVAVGVWLPGRGSYLRATGVADLATGEPMRTDMMVRIGSETKTFTVTALLELVDQGLVGLDDPIAKYVDGVPDGANITLRQLAGMRSGLFPYTSDEELLRTVFTDPGRSWTPQELLAYGFRHDNTFAPGAQFEYSNTNLILLGLVVEKMTHRDLAEVIRDRVVRPAHLHRTFLPSGPEFPQPHPHGYTLDLAGQRVDATDWNPSWAWAAGAMISDLPDLRRWAKVVATGELLSPATQAQRLRFEPTGFPGTGYGLGLIDSDGWIGHNGSLPGYETVTVYLPEQDATLVMMLNTDQLVGTQEPSSLFARAITEIITPDHVYDPKQPPLR